MSPSEPSRQPIMTGRRILVGITGGIACYKTCSVVSALVQRGVQVTCVMTRSATRFVKPLTFEALSGRAVLVSRWRSVVSHDPQHIHLCRDAELAVIAPATANFIAKMACGLADDLLSTLYLALRCPVLIAPAMNDQMWAHPAVQENMSRLVERGTHVVGPESGWMACRSVGMGRMSEPDQIIDAIERAVPPTALPLETQPTSSQ